MLAAAPSVLTR